MPNKLWLDVVHPRYAELAPHWEFCRRSYEGGPGYLAANLIKYRLEDEQDFADRLKRAARYNLTRQAVELTNGHLFKAAPVRKPEKAPDPLVRFWAEATRDHDGINGLMREATKWASVYGRVYIVVDVERPEVEPQTELERQEMGLEPYAYLVPPDDVLDLAHGSDGELAWIKIRERYRVDADPRNAAAEMSERYRLWERGRWSLWEKRRDTQGREDAVLLAEGELPFVEIPVVILEHEDGDQYASPGLIDDTAYLDRDVFNLCSELTETLNSQTFGQLIIPSDAIPGSQDFMQYVAMGKKRIFTYDAQASHPPAYIQPDASQGRLILDTIEARIEQVYRSVNLLGEVGQSGGSSSAASGVNMAYQFAKLQSTLATMAEEAEEAEREIAELVCMWSGLGEDACPEDLVTYPREFDVVSLQQALTDALSVESVLGGSSPTAVAELRKQVIAKSLDRLEDDVLKVITDEIDAWAAVEKSEPHEDEEAEHDPNLNAAAMAVVQQEKQGGEPQAGS